MAGTRKSGFITQSLYKFFGNKILTKTQNLLLGTAFSEFHSGYRLYSVEALKKTPFERNTNDFHFDTEITIQPSRRITHQRSADPNLLRR